MGRLDSFSERYPRSAAQEITAIIKRLNHRGLNRYCSGLAGGLQFFMPEKRERTEPRPRPPEREEWRRIDESYRDKSTKHEPPEKHGVSDTHETPPPKKE